jgi:tetratricopeptide (TPR) repeat protein
MDAMAQAPHAPPSRGLAQLWQLPLLIFALALFGYAAWLFIDPRPGQSIAQRIDQAHRMLKAERVEAAIERCNLLLASGKLQPLQEGAVRMMLGEAIALGQEQRKLNIRDNHARIVEQTKRAIGLGIEADARVHQRLAESFEALGKHGDALEHFRRLAETDDAHALKWERKLIALHLKRDDDSAAEKAIEAYLRHADLTDSERAWAMGEQARIMIDRGQLVGAWRVLDEAAQYEASEATEQGRLNYWRGYCAWKLGQIDLAEKHLRVARDQFTVQHPLDGDAAYALGRIHQQRMRWAEASAFYEAVLQSHPDARVASLARLGRAVSRIATRSEEAGLHDFSELMRLVREKQAVSERFKQEMVAALRQASELLSSSGKVAGALEIMGHEHELVNRPPADFYRRLGRLYELHAEALAGEIAADGQGVEKAAKQVKVREALAKAGDAYVGYSRELTLRDDRGYGEALWKGIALYDQAGDLPRAMGALETFIQQRPDDALAPDAVLRLGQAYHAAGLFDRAIDAYRQNQAKYANSLAASKSGVPLARAYVAKGPEFYGKAEEALKRVLQDNPQITPDAEEFKESLFELANLYYRTQRFELAVNRLEEMVERYPGDARRGQSLFLMADSYRKSAALLEDQSGEMPIKASVLVAGAGVLRVPATGPSATPTTRPALEVAEARRERGLRLAKARDAYARVIEQYKGIEASSELDRLYLKLAHFYQADCVYDLGDFPEAIRLYGEAAFKYQEDPSALAAYVQIVNANVALGRLEEAKAANERAKWMLRRMPAEAFSDSGGTFGMPQAYWEQWLRWSGEAGIWK